MWFPILLILMPAKVSFGQENLANRKFELYRFSEAAPIYKSLFYKDGTRSDLARRVGDCYRLISEWDSAKIWYEKAVIASNNDSSAIFWLGQAHRSTGNYNLAVQYFQKYITDFKPADSGNVKKLIDSSIKAFSLWKIYSPNTEIVNLESVNSSASDFSPIVFKNKLIFTSDRNTDTIKNKDFSWTGRGFLNLYETELLFEPENALKTGKLRFLEDELNQKFHDGPIFFSNDSTFLITKAFKNKSVPVSNGIKTFVLKIFSGNLKENRTLIPFEYNSDLYSCAHPVLNNSQTRLYFSSDMPGGHGGMDLYYCDLMNGKWSEPVNLGNNINTQGNEVFPYIKTDSIVYFASDYHPGYGGLDIFYSKLAEAGFGVPVNMHQPVNSSYDDFGIFLLPNSDFDAGFLSSSRKGGLGSDDLYYFRNKPLVLSGFVKDKKSFKPIPECLVFLLDSIKSEVLVLKTDSSGQYFASIDRGNTYNVLAVKQLFTDDCLIFKPFQFAVADTLYPRDLLLDYLEIDRVVVLNNIYYNFDKWDIRKDAESELNWLTNLLTNNPVTIELSSHTDSRGSFEYNMKLSEKRAESAKKYLLNNGIAKERIVAKGYGESQLINQCNDTTFCTPALHQANRRTEFKITGYIDFSEFDPEINFPYQAGQILHLNDLGLEFFFSCYNSRLNKTDSLIVYKAPENLDVGYLIQPEKDCYSVRLFTHNQFIDLNDPIWRGLNNMNIYTFNGIYNFLAGCFNNFESALAYQKSLLKLGYTKTDVVKQTPEGLLIIEK